MASKSAIERICGALLVALPVVIITFLSTDSQFNTYDQSFQESLREVVDSPGLFKADMTFLLVSRLVSIALAVAMYLAFRTHERTLALFGAFWFLGLGMTMVVGTLGGVALAHMADQFETATALNSSMIAACARPFHVMYDLERARRAGAALIVRRLCSAAPQCIDGLAGRSAPAMRFYILEGSEPIVGPRSRDSRNDSTTAQSHARD